MHFQQSDLDLMKRDVGEFGVEALLTPEGLRLLIADLEEARATVRLQAHRLVELLKGAAE